MIFSFSSSLFSQIQNSKWFFGAYTGLDFIPSTPSILSSTLGPSSWADCASIADASGNLLFYTDGVTIYNSTHTLMANGSGLNGYSSVGGNSPLIAKQPGNSNIYYLFSTNSSTVSGGGLYYSVIDMSLAAGLGSVTTKNAVLLNAPVFKFTQGTRHCNGTDYWIIAHDQANVYYSYLLTSAGITSVAVTSTIGTSANSWPPNLQQAMSCFFKISPNGKKIATYISYVNVGYVDLCDFDNSNGLISNFSQLYLGFNAFYSGEFSPDCSKFYATSSVGQSYPAALKNVYQFDLCAGTLAQIQSSSVTVGSANVTGVYGMMEIAPNGKIYIAKGLDPYLAVINNPNAAGTSCNFVDQGQLVGYVGSSTYGLINTINVLQKPSIPNIAFTVNINPCQNVNFTSPVLPGTAYGCGSFNSYTLQSLQWDFGDPVSTSNNTSTLIAPSHTFSSIGTYTVKLILNYGCGGGIDTLKQVININQSCFSVSTTSITCANLGSATVTPQGSGGPFTYSWLPTSQTSSVATNLIPGTYTLLVYDPGINYTHTLTQQFNPITPLTGNVSNSSSITCPAASSGTGAITGINGGSSLQYFLWTNGTTNFTSSSTNSLSAGLWTVTVTDALTACTFSNLIFVLQPPLLNLTLSSNTPTNCAGANIVLTGTNSGGTPFSSGPPYTYTWNAGPANDTQTVTQSTNGTFVYTLNSSDANNCLSSNTIAVDFIANPLLSVSNVSICPLAIGTLTVSGASNYTWSSPSTTALSTGNSFTDAPLSTQQYTVVGEALGCSSQTMASIVLYNPPNATLLDNGPRCNGDLLSLSGYGGISYVWSGPNSFTSTSSSNSINPVSLVNAGVYNLTVTAASGCTASVSKTVVVNPTPPLSASGSTVCTTQTVNLSASSFTGSTYLWSGPPNFTSSLQNPFITNPLTTNTGTYTVKVTSANGCTNIAFATASVTLPPSLTAQLSSNTLCSQAFNGSPNTITLTAGGANTYTLVTVPDMFNANPGGPISPLSAIPPNTGIASATLSGSNGVCTVTTSLTFSILPNPSITVSSPTPVICAGDTYTYTNNGASSYTWSSSTPGFTTYNNGGVAVSNPSINSVFSVFGGSLGCNSASKTSTITVNPLPVFSISPGTPTICLNNKITLSINGNASSYTWSPYVGLSSNVGSTVNAFPTSLQTYTALGSLNSCTITALITVSVLSLPSPTATVLKPELCLQELITLQGFGGETYRWDGPLGVMYAGQTVTFVANTLYYSGNYTLTVHDKNGCEASNQVGVKINPLPAADLYISKQSGCVPFSAKFSMYTQSAKDSNLVAYWQLENQTFYGKGFSYVFSSAKTYSIYGYYSDTLNTCKNSGMYVVEGFPLPKAGFNFEPEKPVEGLDEVQFVNTSQGEELKQFNWYFINNEGYTSDNKNTSYLFNELGEYPVAMVVQNKWGCSDTMVKSIKVEADFNVYVPNAFTPNGDGLNEVFLPIVRGVKLYELMIFDRWGKRIFLSNQIESGWDGYYNGEPAKNDVYTWKINLSTNSGEAKVYTGQVMLSR